METGKAEEISPTDCRDEPEPIAAGLDRKGRPLASNGKVVSVGVVPGQIHDETGLLSTLQQQLKIAPDQARRAYQNAQPDWFVPLLDLSTSQAEALRPKLQDLPGILFRDKPARVYPNGTVAAHLVGYLSKATAEDLKSLASMGYGEDDLVGRSGIEGWAEKTLAGERGGKLSIVTPEARALLRPASRQCRI